MSYTESEMWQPVLGPVWADFRTGRRVTITHNGKVFHKAPSLGDYWVGEDGSVYRGDKIPMKFVRTHLNTGRPYVAMYIQETRYFTTLARLVLAACKGAPMHGYTKVKHLDGDLKNCSIANLMYDIPECRRVSGNKKRWREIAARRRGEAIDRDLDASQAATALYMAGKGKTAATIAARLACSESAVEKALAKMTCRQKGKESESP